LLFYVIQRYVVLDCISMLTLPHIKIEFVIHVSSHFQLHFSPYTISHLNYILGFTLARIYLTFQSLCFLTLKLHFNVPFTSRSNTGLVSLINVTRQVLLLSSCFPGTPLRINVDARDGKFVSAYGPGLSQGGSGEQVEFYLTGAASKRK